LFLWCPVTENGSICMSTRLGACLHMNRNRASFENVLLL
jgi:hypothetical protein